MIIVLGLIFGFQNCAKNPYRKLANKDESQTLELRHFYLVKENYQCQTMLGESVETYADSFYFFGGNVCFTGDGCNDFVACEPWPTDLEVALDLESATYKGEVYHHMKTPPFVEF